WQDADREGPREPELVAVAEEGEWALALDPRLDRSPHAERPARYGPPEPHRGERREQRSTRLGREECQLEDAVTVVRPRRQPDPTPERALVGDEEPVRLALDRPQAAVGAPVGDAQAVDPARAGGRWRLPPPDKPPGPVQR